MLYHVDINCHFIFYITIAAIRINYNGECNHYYDYPIVICFSVNSSRTGLQSYKYICNLNTSNSEYNIRLNIYNGTDDCSFNSIHSINSTLIYNLTRNDLNLTQPRSNPSVSCRGNKPCPYF